jgi:parallel beta-helix repeat protein
LLILAVVAGPLALGTSNVLAAGTTCVNPGGTGGCYSTIQDGVDAVAPGGTVNVAAGTYREDVSITKALSLSGAGAATTAIDATGLANGIVVNGVNAPTGITGFTVENANLEGILLQNSAQVTVEGNVVRGNDKNLKFVPPPGTSSCSGAYPLDSDDCGEAIHLRATSNSTIASNTVGGPNPADSNAGGILLTDEAGPLGPGGPTHDNTISGNTVENNLFDCGITLASHYINPAAASPVGPSVGGVYNNMVVNNTSMGNGAAGVGMFAAGPGGAAYNNTVANNTVSGNGLPGVSIHSHAPHQSVNGNTITNNLVGANGIDEEEAIAGPPNTTGIDVLSDPGAAPVASVTIEGNQISGSHYGIFAANVLSINGLSNNQISTTAGGTPVFWTKFRVFLPAIFNAASASHTVTLPNRGASH